MLLLSACLGSAVAPPLVHAFRARATLTGVGLLPFAMVEHLASVLRSATYEPGDVIIREGISVSPST